jgi:hypothetical protein
MCYSSCLMALYECIEPQLNHCCGCYGELPWWALELILVTSNRHCSSCNPPAHLSVLMKLQKLCYVCSLIPLLNFQERYCELSVIKHIIFDVVWRTFSYFLKKALRYGIISLSNRLISLLLHAREVYTYNFDIISPLCQRAVVMNYSDILLE